MIALLERWRELLKNHLAAILVLLFAVQPLMDICSFWLDKLGMSTAPTLLLRMLVFALTALIGFCLSDKKRYYWGLAAICAVFFVCHAVSCMRAGYISPFADLTNYIRVIQIPVFALCLITFLRADTQSYHWVSVGFAVSFAIISAVVLLSVVTGTNPYTYVDDQMGILGWFSTTNSQASIVSMMTPILICMAYKSKRTWLFAATTVLACAQLYFLGTRLAYMAIFVSIFGTILVAALCGEVKKLRCGMLLLVAVVCVLGVKQSPMYQHQQTYSQFMEEKQTVLNSMSADRGTTVTKEEVQNAEEGNAKLELLHTMNQIYCYYRSDLVQRFGVERVMEKCGFSNDVSQMTAARKTKIIFCELLMDEMPETSRLFGIERDAMTYKGESYDVENDFHGIYFLYGAVGLGLFIIFLAYFAVLIVIALFRNVQKYFTMEAGAYGMAFLLALANAYNTAGILRRPNASFYLSVILAVIFYLTRIKQYPETQPKGIFALFGKKKTIKNG